MAPAHLRHFPEDCTLLKAGADVYRVEEVIPVRESSIRGVLIYPATMENAGQLRPWSHLRAPSAPQLSGRSASRFPDHSLGVRAVRWRSGDRGALMNHPSTSQQVKVRVNVLPTKVRSRISVSKTPRRVVVRTYRSAEARVTVRITAKGPGLRTPTWKRTWRVR